jgi:hypothetical protein
MSRELKYYIVINSIKYVILVTLLTKNKHDHVIFMQHKEFLVSTFIQIVEAPFNAQFKVFCHLIFM